LCIKDITLETLDKEDPLSATYTKFLKFNKLKLTTKIIRP